MVHVSPRAARAFERSLVSCSDDHVQDMANGWAAVKGRGRESCKGEQHGSANVNVVSSAIDEPSNTALINSGNKNGMEKGNIKAWSTPIGNTASNTGFESFPTISEVHGIPSPTNEENLNDVGTTVRPTSVGNTHGMSSYANVIGELSRKALSFHTLFTPEGNGIDVVVLVESIRANSERFANIAYGFFLGKRVAYPIVANYVRNTWGKYGLFIRNHPRILKKWNLDVNLLKENIGNVLVWVQLHGVPVTAFSEDGLSGRSSFARAMIELRADMELKDIIVVAMTKLTREGFYTCIIRVEYNWKPLRCACCKIFGHIQEECPMNSGLGVAKNLKKPSQAPRGVPVGSKVGFKPVKQAYRPVSTKPTANTSGSKKNDVEPTKKLSNLNPLIASTTPIVDKIEKFEKLIIDRKVTLVDDEGELVKKVNYPVDHDSEDEVASVDNDMVRSMASKKAGFRTNSLLEQWRDTYENDDYDYDPYDDDMYDGQEIPDNIQAICDNLDIKVDAFNMGCNGDQNSLYSIPRTFDVPSLHRIDVDGDDGIDPAPNVEDEESEDKDDENS
ncbi:putative reverse transcriptase domain-containing protein [Tanacetum coccineum]